MKRVILTMLISVVLLCGCSPTGSNSNPNGNNALQASSVGANASGASTSSGTQPSSAQPVEDVKIDVKKIIGSTNTRSKVEFGQYWQEDTNGDGKCDKRDDKLPIVWQIIDVTEDGDAFLVSDKILDEKPYNKERTTVTWETCSLRKWLNGNNEGDFLKEAFNQEETDCILDTVVKTAGYTQKIPGGAEFVNGVLVPKDFKETYISGGNDTKDKLFLLSLEEVENPKYKWPDDKSRELSNINIMRACFSSNFVMSAYNHDKDGQLYGLRTTEGDIVSFVMGNGETIQFSSGTQPIYVEIELGVRPALWVNLKKADLVDKIKYEQPVPSK